MGEWSEDAVRHFPNLDPGLYRSHMKQEEGRAHSVREGDLLHLADGRVEQVISKRDDAPGRSGRMVHLTTESGEYHYPLNEMVSISRGDGRAIDDDPGHGPGSPRTRRS